MLKLFNRKRKPAAMVGVWTKLSAAIDAKARRWANYLNAKFAHVNSRNLLYVLIAFCILWSVSTLLITKQALQEKPGTISIKGISIPVQINGSHPALEDTSLQKAVMRIEHFKSWLDSLHNRQSPLYDSIIHERPGLLDSIQFIEQYYSLKK